MKTIKKVLLFFALLGLVACQSSPAENKDNSTDKNPQQPVVYTSFYPIYDLTKSIAGEDLDVKSLMPLDVEAHDWEPSAKDMKDLSSADLLIINGASMEPWVDQVKEALPDLKILDLSQGLDLLNASEDEHEEADAHDHDHEEAEDHHHHHGDTDPHTFLSIKNAIQYVDKINLALKEIQPDTSQNFDQRSKDLSQELSDLLTKYQKVFSEKKSKTFIVPHSAFAYLAKDFNLDQYPLQGLTSVDEPDLKTIQEAITTCEKLGITKVFYEYGGPSKGAETIAKEAKVETAPLATMEMQVPSKGSKEVHYVDLMEMNLENISESLDS